MSGSTRTMTGLTVAGLVVATAYSVALGGSPWVWLTWLVVALATAAMVVTGRR
ncbi:MULTISPECIES: hypothetical protein [Streptomyces]|uniref:Integral membrane protein n=1 Tax=Streptomyces ramulosus TaxID=47762 RepID=A0ABW1FC82_9ACTN